jgi:hypothetical protein
VDLTRSKPSTVERTRAGSRLIVLDARKYTAVEVDAEEKPTGERS